MPRPTLTHLWQLLPPAAILFQAGISGAWWAAQFHAPLPPLWGWFGAILIGIAAWSGIHLAVAGERRGWLLALVAVSLDAVMAAAYFGANHPLTLALPLALAPALITLLVAWQAARQTTAAALPAQLAAAEQRQWELDQDARDREAARRRLERDAEAHRKAQLIAAEAQAAAVRLQAERPGQLSSPVQPVQPLLYGQAPVPAPVPDGDARLLDTLIGTSLSIRQAAALLDIPPSTLHTHVQRLHLVKNGHGWTQPSD